MLITGVEDDQLVLWRFDQELLLTPMPVMSESGSRKDQDVQLRCEARKEGMLEDAIIGSGRQSPSQQFYYLHFQ